MLQDADPVVLDNTTKTFGKSFLDDSVLSAEQLFNGENDDLAEAQNWVAGHFKRGSVLIHSTRGVNRAAAFAIAIQIRRFAKKGGDTPDGLYTRAERAVNDSAKKPADADLGNCGQVASLRLEKQFKKWLKTYAKKLAEEKAAAAAANGASAAPAPAPAPPPAASPAPAPPPAASPAPAPPPGPAPKRKVAVDSDNNGNGSKSQSNQVSGKRAKPVSAKPAPAPTPASAPAPTPAPASTPTPSAAAAASRASLGAEAAPPSTPQRQQQRSSQASARVGAPGQSPASSDRQQTGGSSMLTGRSASVPPPGQRPMREDGVKRLRRDSEPKPSSTARSTVPSSLLHHQDEAHQVAVQDLSQQQRPPPPPHLPPPPPPPQMQQPAALMAMAAGGGAAAASPVAASPVATSPGVAAAASPIAVAKKWVITNVKNHSEAFKSLAEREKNRADKDITKDVFKQVFEEAVEQARLSAQRTLTLHLIPKMWCPLVQVIRKHDTGIPTKDRSILASIISTANESIQRSLQSRGLSR